MIKDTCPACGKKTYKLNNFNHLMECTNCGFVNNQIQLTLNKIKQNDKKYLSGL